LPLAMDIDANARALRQPVASGGVRACLPRPPHQSRIPRHIGGQYRRQSTLNPLPAHHANRSRNWRRDFQIHGRNALRTGKHPTRLCSRRFRAGRFEEAGRLEVHVHRVDVEMGGRLPFGVNERGGVGIRLEPAAAIVRQCGERCRRAPRRRQSRRAKPPPL